MRRWGKRPRAAAAVVAIGIVGLSLAGSHLHGASPQHHPSRTVAPRPTMAAPPTNADGPIGGLSTGLPQVVDAAGAVPEATAQAWAVAFLASVHWTVEAVEREQPDLLGHLYAAGQADAATLQLIGDARAGAAQLSYPPGREPHATRLLLVSLSADQQAAIRRDGGTVGGPYAWVVTWTGPTDLLVRWPGGRVQTYAILRDGEQVTELSVGSALADPTLGAVWRETASRDCSAHPDPILCPA